MIYGLMLYAGIVTILLTFIWIQNKNTFKELLSEMRHSSDLRKTILEYIRNPK